MGTRGFAPRSGSSGWAYSLTDSDGSPREPPPLEVSTGFATLAYGMSAIGGAWVAILCRLSSPIITLSMSLIGNVWKDELGTCSC